MGKRNLGSKVPMIPNPDYIDSDTWESPGFKEFIDEVGRGYTDGAGGPKSIPESIRQVSFGAVTMKHEIGQDGAAVLIRLEVMGGQVPGKQTVPRAELWAAIQLISRADPGQHLDVGRY